MVYLQNPVCSQWQLPGEKNLNKKRSIKYYHQTVKAVFNPLPFLNLEYVSSIQTRKTNLKNAAWSSQRRHHWELLYLFTHEWLREGQQRFRINESSVKYHWEDLDWWRVCQKKKKPLALLLLRVWSLCCCLPSTASPLTCRELQSGMKRSCCELCITSLYLRTSCTQRKTPRVEITTQKQSPKVRHWALCSHPWRSAAPSQLETSLLVKCWVTLMLMAEGSFSLPRKLRSY